MDNIKCKKLIGLIVKNKRDELGLTQEELSAQLDIDQSNLSNIENGKITHRSQLSVHLLKL